MRVLLILVDGMRPDSLTDIQKAQEIIKKSSYTLENGKGKVYFDKIS